MAFNRTVTQSEYNEGNLTMLVDQTGQGTWRIVLKSGFGATTNQRIVNGLATRAEAEARVEAAWGGLFAALTTLTAPPI